ncbi:expressed unknown protein [Seminavis robusta]|uniref:Uncharacterized protein n=1 Tax=Seminavis robusta TaxID=568900 RepID=A0A9N8DA91_9STRA|nr:expressed unknown protein [Seminavis robusta]|eukprot:Sro62_g035400.1 n/a (591) ;mRNA; f:78833-80605
MKQPSISSAPTCTSFASELTSFKTAAVRQAAENLLKSRKKQPRRVSTFRAVRVVQTNETQEPLDNAITNACTTTTTWVTPHGKAAIVSDFLQIDATSSNKKRRRFPPVPHDLTEIHMLTNNKKQRLLELQEMALTNIPTAHQKPAQAYNYYKKPGCNDEMERNRQRALQQTTNVIEKSKEKTPPPKQKSQQPNGKKVEEPKISLLPKKVKKSFVVLAPKVQAPPAPVAQPTTCKPVQAPPATVAQPTNTVSVIPAPPLWPLNHANVTETETVNPPHVDPKKYLTRKELEGAWAEHYRSRHQHLKRQQQTQPPTKPRVLQEHNQNSKATTKPKTLRKLPKAVVVKPPKEEESPNSVAVVEILDDSPESKSNNQASITIQQQRDRRHDQELRRLRRIEVAALEAYGVSTVAAPNAKTSSLSQEFHTFLCWFKQSVLTGQWIMEHNVAPTNGWQTYVSRSILVLHLKRLPKSYLLGATMYQRPSTKEWQDRKDNNNDSNPPYHVSCHALMELSKDKKGTIPRKWANWKDIPEEYQGTIFTYMIQKLIHTRREGILYQFPDTDHIKHLLAKGPVNGRDLEVVTVVLGASPSWFV